MLHLKLFIFCRRQRFWILAFNSGVIADKFVEATLTHFQKVRIKILFKFLWFFSFVFFKWVLFYYALSDMNIAFSFCWWCSWPHFDPLIKQQQQQQGQVSNRVTKREWFIWNGPNKFNVGQLLLTFTGNLFKVIDSFRTQLPPPKVGSLKAKDQTWLHVWQQGRIEWKRGLQT